jgi:hypothetical protein
MRRTGGIMPGDVTGSSPVRGGKKHGNSRSYSGTEESMIARQKNEHSPEKMKPLFTFLLDTYQRTVDSMKNVSDRSFL